MFIVFFLFITCSDLQLKKHDLSREAERQNIDFMKLISKRKTKNEIRSIFKELSPKNSKLLKNDLFSFIKKSHKPHNLDLQNYQGMDLVKINEIILPKITLFLILRKIKRFFNEKKFISLKIKEVLDKKKRKSLRIYILEKEMMYKNIDAGINSFILLFRNLLNMKCPENELSPFFDTMINILYRSIKNLKQGSIKKKYYIFIKNDIRIISLKEVQKIFCEMFVDLLINTKNLNL